MMARMRLATMVGTTIALLAGIQLGCGGGGKGADSPGTCPEGTVLKGSDCVPSDDSSSSSTPPSKHVDDDDTASTGGGSGGGGSSGAGGSSGGDSSSSGGKVPYDKDAVEVQLKRAARQIKGNCGAATDENGQATGPWGTTKASVTLGRNGRVKDVTVPSPYDGKPAGLCAVNAFKKIQFPPYAGSSDVVLDWDIEIVQPKK
jgi:hypothetical protein